MARTFIAIAGLVAVALAGCAADDESGSEGTPNQTLDQLRATYVDQPYKGGQATPEHTWLQVTPDNILFLHWNHADPMQASGLLFVGDGFRARGCVGDGGVTPAQVAAGFVHFHKETESNWDRGHHTVADNPDVMGYWLRHVGATNAAGPMPGMPAIVRGEIYPLMPSHENAPACA